MYTRITSLTFLFILSFSFPAISSGNENTSDVRAPLSSSSCLITVNSTHDVRLIDDGLSALENILEMIDRAKKSVELEYFIFSPDRSGRLVLQALARKAHEGVKVRILLDYYAHRGKPEIDEFYQDELARHGVEIKYFNVANILAFWKVGFRDHRKFLIIDDKEMLVGGRNIADEYFGIHERMNYLDRDIWISGPITKSAIQFFNYFWVDPIVSKLPPPEEPVMERRSHPYSSRPITKLSDDRDLYERRLREYRECVEKARDTLTSNAADAELLQQLARVGKSELAKEPIVQVHSITLASDLPDRDRASRVLTFYMQNILEKTQASLLIENFAFLPKDQKKKAFLELLEHGVQIDLLTNSFFSEPNVIMAELANSRQHMAVTHGMKVFCYNAGPKEGQVFIGEEARKSFWGLHTKTIVIDDKASLIGSYNLDPRSEWINVEDTVCVNDSPEFAKLVKDKTIQRINSSYAMNEDGSYRNGPEDHGFLRLLTIIFRPALELFTNQL